MDFELSKILQMALDNSSLKNIYKQGEKVSQTDCFRCYQCFSLRLLFTVDVYWNKKVYVCHKQSNVPLRSGIQGVVWPKIWKVFSRFADLEAGPVVMLAKVKNADLAQILEEEIKKLIWTNN